MVISADFRSNECEPFLRDIIHGTICASCWNRGGENELTTVGNTHAHCVSVSLVISRRYDGRSVCSGWWSNDFFVVCWVQGPAGRKLSSVCRCWWRVWWIRLWREFTFLPAPPFPFLLLRIMAFCRFAPWLVRPWLVRPLADSPLADVDGGVQ